MVGHTHEDIDQVFSRISTKLAHYDSKNLINLHEGIKESYTPQPVVQNMCAVYDYKRMLATNSSLVGISTPHVFKFSLNDENEVEMFYKDWPNDNEPYRSVVMTDMTVDLFNMELQLANPNPKYTTVVESMKKDLPKWCTSGRLNQEDVEWWEEYMENVKTKNLEAPEVKGINTLKTFEEPAVDNPPEDATMAAINNHLGRLQNRSEVCQ